MSERSVSCSDSVRASQVTGPSKRFATNETPGARSRGCGSSPRAEPPGGQVDLPYLSGPFVVVLYHPWLALLAVILGKPMLTSILVALILAGLALWAIKQFPLDATTVKLIRVVLVVAAVLYVLSAALGQHWFQLPR